MSKKKILIADDHSAIRTGLKHILMAGISDLEFGEARNGEEVYKKIVGSEKEHWDILILDIALSESNGIEILKTLSRYSLKTLILIFSIYSEDQMAVRCMRNGAHGFINKAATAEEIVKAVQNLLQGKRYISESVASSVIEHLDDSHDTPPHQKLSDREYEVLLLIGQGKTITEIANHLNLGVSTVNTYRSRILKKMNITNNVGLINYVIKNNLQPYI